MISQPAFSSPEQWVARPILAAQAPGKIHPGWGTPPSQGAVMPTSTRTQTGTVQTHQFILCACLWDVGGNQSPRENPCRHRENMQISQRQWSQRGGWFFPP